MPTYAVHYSWIPGHDAHGPVGIWDAVGASYYPELTAKHQASGGSQLIPVVNGQFSHTFDSWLEMKAESISTNSNWRRVDSDRAMQEVLDEMLAEFLAKAHPVGHLIAEEESSAPEPAKDEPHEITPPPAHRRVLAESWWIASELAARHPERLVHEMHPGGGSYDCLTVVLPGADSAQIYLNREGSVQVHGAPGEPEKLRLTWAYAMAADSPHEIVRKLEVAAELELRGKRPPTTPRTLVYRVIAAFLGQQLNDRDNWDARNEFYDTSGDGRPHHGYLADFPKAVAAARRADKIGIWGEPESHFWAVLRNGEPVALLSIEGQLYIGDTELELFPIYEQTRSVAAVVARGFASLLR